MIINMIIGILMLKTVPLNIILKGYSLYIHIYGYSYPFYFVNTKKKITKLQHDAFSKPRPHRLIIQSKHLKVRERFLIG